MNILDEAQNLEELTPLAKSMIKYAKSLESDLKFEKKSDWWLPTDERNFIGFQFHWKRTLNITISLWGEPIEHLKQDDLEIKLGRFNTYSECRITGFHQLMPASVSIWRAHQLFKRGKHPILGDRKKSPLVLTDSRSEIPENWLRPRPIPPGWMDCGTPYMMDLTDWHDEVKQFALKNGLRDPQYVNDQEFLDPQRNTRRN